MGGSVSDEIKVGDVCIVNLGCACSLCSMFNGIEVTTVAISDPTRNRLGPHSFEPVPDGFECEFRGIRDFVFKRSELRKKPPKAAESQVIRQETVPRADFDRWLERVREQKREHVKEPA